MCDHDMQNWIINSQTVYHYINDDDCLRINTIYTKCLICGEEDEYITYIYGCHDWETTDMGHVPNTAYHDYEHSCTQCNHTKTERIICPYSH